MEKKCLKDLPIAHFTQQNISFSRAAPTTPSLNNKLKNQDKNVE